MSRTSRPIPLRLFGAALLPLLLAGCEAEAVELVQEIGAARGDCTREGLKASDEACVQMMERYAGMGTELMETYIGGLKAMDRALDRMPPPRFDTAGVGYALSPEFRAGDPLGSSASPRFERGPVGTAAWGPPAEPVPAPAISPARAPLGADLPGAVNLRGGWRDGYGRAGATRPPARGGNYGADAGRGYGSDYPGDGYGRYPGSGYGDPYGRLRRDDRYGPASRRSLYELQRERYGPLSGDRWYYLDRYENGRGAGPYGYTPFEGYLPPYGGLSRAWSYGAYPGAGYGYGGYGYDGYGYGGYGYGPADYGYGAGGYSGYATNGYGYGAYGYDGYTAAGWGYGDPRGGAPPMDPGYGRPVPDPREEYDDAYGDVRPPAEDWGYAGGGEAPAGGDVPAAAPSAAPPRPAPQRPGILLPPEERLRRPWLDD